MLQDTCGSSEDNRDCKPQLQWLTLFSSGHEKYIISLDKDGRIVSKLLMDHCSSLVFCLFQCTRCAMSATISITSMNNTVHAKSIMIHKSYITTHHHTALPHLSLMSPVWSQTCIIHLRTDRWSSYSDASLTMCSHYIRLCFISWLQVCSITSLRNINVVPYQYPHILSLIAVYQ